MKWALDKKERRIQAEPNKRAKCPVCRKLVIAKCGRIKVWHWAHKEIGDCEAYSEGETDWHLYWKWYIDQDNSEVIKTKNGVRRIADIVGNNGIVIELQHSSLSPDEVEDREQFYGRMIWLFDAKAYLYNLILRDKQRYYSFRWKHPRKFQWYAKKPIFWDFGVRELPIYRETSWGASEKVFLEKKHYILEVKKIYPNLPCGGYGYLGTIEEFEKRFLSDVMVDMPPRPVSFDDEDWDTLMA